MPDPDIFGNLITVVNKDGSLKPPADTFRWTEKKELPTSIEEFRAEYMQQPIIRIQDGTTCAVANDSIKERSLMASNLSSLSQTIETGQMLVKRFVPSELQDFVYRFFEPDPLNNERELVLMRSRRSGMDYLRETAGMADQIKELAKGFKEHIDRCAFSQGYVMDDGALLPSDMVECRSLIDMMIQSMMDDRDFFNIDIVKPLSASYVSGEAKLEGCEEKMEMNIIAIDLSTHLYWIDRFANQMRGRREEVLDRFKSMCLRYWPKRNVEEIEYSVRRFQAARAARSQGRRSANDMAEALKALGKAPASKDMAKPLKSSAKASATVQTGKKPEPRKGKKPEPRKERAIDL